jgi:hypothetical protein
VQDVSELPRRDPREEADDAEGEPLRTCDAQLLTHAFRCPVESMHQAPEQSHELEHVWQVCRVSGGYFAGARHAVSVAKHTQV